MVNEKTLQAYKDAGVEYQYKGYDDHLKKEREKTSNKEKKRKINSMYRFRTNESEEYLLYEQDIITKSNHTDNVVQWHEDFANTSKYFVPIVEHRLDYDQETEKQTSNVKQILYQETHYLIPFTEEEIAKLKPFCNLATKYYVWQEDGLMSAISDFDDWLKLPFETLLRGPEAIDLYKAALEEDAIEEAAQTAAIKPKVSKS